MVNILSKEHQNLCLCTVGDPHLFSVEDVMRAVFGKFGFADHRCSVGSSSGLGERVSTDLPGCEAGQVRALLMLVTMEGDGHRAQPHVDTKHDGKRGVNASQFLNDDGF